MIFMQQTPADGLASGNIPDLRRVVPAGGNKAAAIGAERGVDYPGPMQQRRPEGLARGSVPDPRRLVVAGSDQAAAIAAEGRVLHGLLMEENLDQSRLARMPPVVAEPEAVHLRGGTWTPICFQRFSKPEHSAKQVTAVGQPETVCDLELFQ